MGSTYDLELNELTDVIVRVNTVPEQTYVSKDGSYQFNINNGNYIIKADYMDQKDNLKYYAIENITINDEGEYIIVIFSIA